MGRLKFDICLILKMYYIFKLILVPGQKGRAIDGDFGDKGQNRCPKKNWI